VLLLPSMEELLHLFADVERVPQDDGPTPVVKINYSSGFIEVMDYFRAVLTRKEISDRAFLLSKKVINLVSANYTAWQFRRQCIEKLGKNLDTELAYTRKIALDSPKNYQVWYHRRVIFGWKTQAEAKQSEPSPEKDMIDKEKEHVDEILALDHKNYHAWSYRHWLLKEYSAWDGELEYVTKHLVTDIRNNSAWSHRFWVVGETDGWNQKVMLREINYAFEHIQICLGNDSAWNYLLGIVVLPGFDQWSNCKLFAEGAIKLAQKGSKSLQELAKPKSFLVELLKRYPDTTGVYKKLAAALCDDLALVTDRIRKAYWLWVKARLHTDVEGETSHEE